VGWWGLKKKRKGLAEVRKKRSDLLLFSDCEVHGHKKEGEDTLGERSGWKVISLEPQKKPSGLSFSRNRNREGAARKKKKGSLRCAAGNWGGGGGGGGGGGVSQEEVSPKFATEKGSPISRSGCRPCGLGKNQKNLYK